MKKKYYKYFWSLVFYLWLISLVIFTARPYSGNSAEHNESIIRWDYFQHFFLYAAIGILFFLANGAFIHKNTRKNNLVLFIAGLFFAGITELYQLWIPGRAFNPADLILNISGLLAGVLAGWKFIRPMKK